jgi:hypothetical protein
MYVLLAAVSVAVIVGLIQAQSAVLAFTVGAVLIGGFILLGLIQGALQGVYSAALFRYATTGDAGTGFDNTLLGDAFRRKS